MTLKNILHWQKTYWILNTHLKPSIPLILKYYLSILCNTIFTHFQWMGYWYSSELYWWLLEMFLFQLIISNVFIIQEFLAVFYQNGSQLMDTARLQQWQNQSLFGNFSHFLTISFSDSVIVTGLGTAAEVIGIGIGTDPVEETQVMLVYTTFGHVGSTI